ncbi:hypothetical protein [Duganella violaceipulchra]|uniref:Uncharacterized protein n=1 Tax=Duganella violaceipulchra TaxID=2849652 RepID=A0AA41L4Q1_9BURK|nr:hypothetical protein [Duganella violaceicalia]MBV6325558.1 hypothetical protein [Duganella violaceicalia]MCP2012707.1 hypothetical protein [Duganella violaceicalia]
MKFFAMIAIALCVASCSKSDERVIVYVDSKEARDKGLEVIAKRQRDLAESDKMLDAELEAAKNKPTKPIK